MMLVNLLPWREAERKESQDRFNKQLMASAIMAVFFAVISHVYFAAILSAHEERNTFIKTEMTELNKQIKEIERLDRIKKMMLARMSVIENLQSSRSGVVYLADELAFTVPDGLFLEEVEKDGKRLLIKGLAESNTQISQYMINLGHSDHFENPNLIVIEKFYRNGSVKKGSLGDKDDFNLKAIRFELEVSHVEKADVINISGELGLDKKEGANNGSF